MQRSLRKTFKKEILFSPTKQELIGNKGRNVFSTQLYLGALQTWQPVDYRSQNSPASMPVVEMAAACIHLQLIKEWQLLSSAHSQCLQWPLHNSHKDGTQQNVPHWFCNFAFPYLCWWNVRVKIPWDQGSGSLYYHKMFMFRQWKSLVSVQIC